MMLTTLVVLLVVHSSLGATCDPHETVADVVFLIKNSVSENYVYLATFVEDITREFILSKSRVQVGAVVYDMYPQRIFDLDSFTDVANISKALKSSGIKKATYGSPRNGFEYVTTRMYRDTEGARDSTTRVVVHVGAADLNQEIDVSKARELENKLGATVVEVAVANDKWSSSLDNFVSYPENYINPDSISNLKSYVDKVVQRVCEIPRFPKTPKPAPVVRHNSCNPPIDIIFAFDSSGGHNKDVDKLAAFAAHISEEFVLGKHSIQVGSVVFGDKIYKGFDLKDYNTYTGLQTGFDALDNRYYNGKENIYWGLSAVRNSMFQPKGGLRPEAAKVLVFLAVGHSINPSYTVKAGNALKNEGVEIIAVDLWGDDTSKEEMKGLASSPNHYFRASYYELYTVEYPVYELICYGPHNYPSTPKPSTTPTPPTPTTSQPTTPTPTTPKQTSSKLTTPTPTTIPKHSTPTPRDPHCAPFVDIVFALDSSGSVGSHWTDEINFAASIAQKFVLGDDDVQVAAISFGSNAETGFYLNTHTDQASLVNGFSSVRNLGRSTATYKGFDLIRTNIFQRSVGARPDAGKFVILITDGESNNEQLTVDAARKLKDDNVQVIAVGIGFVKLSELQAVATSHQDVFLARDFHFLPEIVDSVYAVMCSR